MEIIAENKKSKFEYFILQIFESGIILLSSELKPLRARQVSIADAYVTEKNGEMWLRNMHITESSTSQFRMNNPKRERKLLLHKQEIKKLVICIRVSGMTIIPLSIYFNNKGFVKIKIAIAKGKKLYDKRSIIKQRVWEREKSRFSQRDG
ncbi:SsrA-binding protein SmpB [Wolbachia endosymbiont of Howardula sp.]|uniref:SsrA-binding protein SmpB n=1 Tax=Wolbachia endosymbiont of Howardula sp. TaxID=2916816 RepID=UPI00217DE56C|nr:SsrA-binding protein SmpB [Wolbachia endosymbiont of Howardula sp.]UWI83343.1 SsrA-binding protein SmpB [Wolbachia endosymbiont of Howardula sp.]